MIIKFYCLRHGEKRGKDHPDGEDGLTEKGKRQVVTSAKTHLNGITFDAVLYSGLKRAYETAGLALRAIGQKNVITLESGLDYRWHLDPDIVPVFQYSEAEKVLKEKNVTNPTIYDWMSVWPPALGMRKMMEGLIRYTSVLQSIYSHEKPEINILMAGHSPVLETAVPDPKNFPRLKEADICLYTVEVNGVDVDIKSATYLSCPPVE